MDDIDPFVKAIDFVVSKLKSWFPPVKSKSIKQVKMPFGELCRDAFDN